MRLIALGASNLTRITPILLRTARRRGPVHAVAALGFGRSFGIRSRMLWRGLPGIEHCGLWPALDALPPAPESALVMDVGNDVLYGAEVARIVDWVEAAVSRLTARGAQVTVAGMPVFAGVEVGRWQFALLRRLLVPSCKLPREVVVERARHLQEALEALASHHRARFVPMRPQWYGFDPMHVRRRAWPELCAALLAAGPDGSGAVRAPWRDRFRVASARPAERWWFGVRRCADQPAVCWEDGSSLSLY